ncbi:GHKL domain-containing protein [Leptospira ognonensis]|uniref:histidine kinase n=1 Tax=Leptospira ognonensis TaxID=2484945 RepID=A0A4R9JYS3_9LEPT|nr:7TM diverse intracellular signaling domain-containing protein [Leptospira ognonensis]TGL57864.1 GHKL domain-containing protein [Leptospira ognonensis]
MSWRYFLLFFCILIIKCQDTGSNHQNKPIPIVQKGILDLRTWDLQNDGYVPLNGNWQFYWKEFVEPASFSSPKVQLEPTFIQVPGIWNGHLVGADNGIDAANEGSPVGGKGYATYRLQIRMPTSITSNSSHVALKIMAQNSSYRLYVNGDLYSEIGKVSAQENESIPAFYTQVIPILKTSNSYDIVFHISNYDQAKGGLWNKIFFGEEKKLTQIRNNNLFLDLFLFGALTLMGFYHLGLYNLRRKDASTLYFGIFCLLMAIRVVMTGEKFLYTLFPNIPLSIDLQIDYISVYMGGPILLHFVHLVLPNGLPNQIRKGLYSISGFFTLMLFVLPSYYFSMTLPIVEIILLIIIFAIIYIMVDSILKKIEGAKSFFIGFSVFASIAINDVLHDNYFIQTGYYAPYGFLIFIFSQSFVLSKRFANSMNQVEDLSQNLEKKVEQRTEELQESKKEIESLNSFLRHINSFSDLDTIFIEISKYIHSKYGINGTLLFLPDENHEFLYPFKAFSYIKLSDDKNDYLLNQKFPMKEREGGMLYKTFQRRKPIYLSHLRKFEYEIDKDFVETLSIKSVLYVPLLIQNECVGIYSFSNLSEPMKLNRNEIFSISNLCIQIAGSVNTNHLLKQVARAKKVAEKQKNEIEMLNEFSKKINENFNLDEILDLVGEYITKNFNISHYLLWRLTENEKELYPYKGTFSEKIPRENIKIFLDLKIPTQEDHGIHAMVCKNKRNVFLRGMKRNRKSESKTENYIQKLLDFESILIVPLVIQNKVIGTMDFSDYSEKMVLTKEDIGKISIFCEQIAGVIHASILFQKIEKAKKETESLNLLVKSLNDKLDLDLIMEKVSNYVSDNYAIQNIGLYTVDPDHKNISLFSSTFPDYVTDIEKKIIFDTKIPIQVELGAHAFTYKTKKYFFIANAQSKRVLKSASPEELYVIHKFNINSFMLMPLLLNNEVIGILDFSNYSSQLKLTKEDISKISILVEQLAGIIHGSNLFKQVQKEKEKAIHAREETERALADLKASQDQLIESEKLAALGQLVAGIAHEINTPIGAIKATASNLKDSLADILRDSPKLIRVLDEALIALAEELILTSEPESSLSAKELRIRKKDLIIKLKNLSVSDADEIADLLANLGISEINERYLPLWRHHKVDEIIRFIASFTGLKAKSDNINIAVEKTVKIIYALKAYTNKDNGGTKREINLHEGIETVLTIYHNYLKQGIEVVREFGDLPKVLCFESDINQIWTNLTFNAIQAMGGKGKLTIRSWKESEKDNQPAQIRIQFEDSGTGIPKPVQSKIFDAFYTTKREGEGSGMGLFIVKQIVDKHSGSIKVESDPGKTLFTVSLPVGE